MTSRKAFLGCLERRTLLMIGASVATLASGLATTPANAQATLSGLMGARASAPKPAAQGPQTTPQRGTTMSGALSRQRATISRAEQIRAYVISARDAVAAANRGTVTDGLSTNGLDPTDAIREAVAAARAGNADSANELLVSASANLDDTGLKTWQGAGLPTQTTTADGKVKIVIDQTQERALLSWNSFNVGANTTLQFNQQQNGTAQPGWVAVNRVTNSIAPSQILGNLQADGTVVVLNQSGIIFGKNAQVNTHSLLASTLELGNAARFVSGSAGPTQATTILERNLAYLENGLFTPANGTASPTGTFDGAALLVSGMTEGDGTKFSATREGSIIVDPGAHISGTAGGFIMLTAPEINSAGALSAIDGQVSLQAGRAIAFQQSTGADSEPDPNVRGFKLNSYVFSGQADGSIVNSGLIESKRGYISLGTGADGTIEHSGLLSTTTSVSRNGKISLTAGQVTLAGSPNAAMASGIEMIADDNGETIPQGSADAPAKFKASQLEIGTQVLYPGQPVGGMVATDLVMGQNALIYAPGANVAVGANTVSDLSQKTAFDTAHPGHIDIATGAVIDVSGLKDVQLDASRNQIEITPVKRGELRDTPNYREVVLDGNFTLNGATLYVDPRVTGVRDDGVAWVGSPLIEAGSLASQISASAAEFMTKGGSVNLQTSELTNFSNVNVATAPSVHVAGGAVIDFSGGWVSYAAGLIKTSKLITNDGRIVDISQANPNDVYVGVAEGFSSIQPRFGSLKTFLNATTETRRYDQAYDEGRDAGALTIDAAAVAVDGTFIGNAFAGQRQINLSERPSGVLAGDSRLLQRTPYQLPSGGGLTINSLGDMIVYHGERGAVESDWSELLLNDQMLSGAGLSNLALSAAGTITFAGAAPNTLQSADALLITGASSVELVRGGTLSLTAGRTIRLDGTVVAPSGSIEAETVLFGKSRDPRSAGTLDANFSNGSAFRQGLYGNGNGDDLPADYLFHNDPGALNPFDVVVTGSLSTAGLWVNDFTEAGIRRGGAFSDGGNISLTTASRVFAAIGSSIPTATQAIDLSGSIRVSGQLDVSSGGYVTPVGGLLLDGKGGNVSLINATVYASTSLTASGAILGDTEGNAAGDKPIEGTNQSVDFTPVPGGFNVDPVFPALVPTPRSTVDIGAASIKGFGFAGGGTFDLIAPDISFGSDNHAGSTHIGLDFFRTTGFGTLSLSSYRSRIVDDVFANDRGGKSAFLETTRLVVGAGETFDLTQWLLPTLLSADQSRALRGLGTGARLTDQSFLAPTTNDALWDRRAANLVLGGLTELDVLAGGQIVGAPGASLTVNKLYNAGNIILHGGTISQRNDLVGSLIIGGLGVDDLAQAFGGARDEAGRFIESAANATGVTDPAIAGRLLTNRELVTKEGADRLIYFRGLLDQGQGVLLDAGSVTDLSGVALVNPRAPFRPNGLQVRDAVVLGGGALELASSRQISRQSSRTTRADGFSGGTLVRDDDATLDISGTSFVVDQAVGLGIYSPYLEWSKAGTISALAGGTLGSTAINARGGDARAEGGTLEWLNPTVGTSDGAGANYLATSLIAQSGFDSLIARGNLTLDGDFSLTLRKALMVTSQDPLIASVPYTADANVFVKATAGSDATIKAGYVRLASRLGANTVIGANEGDARVTLFGGAQGIDVAGAINIDGSIGSITLATPGDVRLIGVTSNFVANAPTYDGGLLTSGDLTIDAGRTYATTGTGNLQALLEGRTAAATMPFYIAALGHHTITFGDTYLNPNASAPLSAGTHISVLAENIVQNGYLAAPLGLIELGNSAAIRLANGSGPFATPTKSVTFGAGSITTVSGAGLNVPYGTTTDGVEYYFPTLTTPITKLPTGELRLSADSIVQEAGALFDGRGGGDVYAYEFQSGVGGSRDVLDRFNRDPFSSNGYNAATGIGYQFADQRQVFALVPVDQIGKIAPYDPSYSADYGSAGPVDLYGASAGRSVFLDGGNGVAGGEYLLVPAKYAMSIPGALRLVENTDAPALIPGTSTRLLDGSVIVGGTFGYAGTGIAESTRHSFTVQSKDTFLKYSQIITTGGSDYLSHLADKNGTGRPRLPLDAARVVLAPLSELRVAGVFDTTAVDGGQGGQFDILGQKILIAGEEGEASDGTLLITGNTLAALNATSLLIGGQRTENADGTTTIAASATNVTVAGDAQIQAPELLLVVGGTNSKLAIEDGARLAAIGNVGTQSDADYLSTTAGSMLRLANGNERLMTRSGTGASAIEIGAASISGDALALDSSGTFSASNDANLAAKWVAIGGQAIRFDDNAAAAGEAGAIGTSLEGKLATAERLTIRSPGAIRFSAGTHQFNDLVLDTATLAATADTAADGSVVVGAGNVRLLNSTKATDGCATVGFCGSAGNFTLDAVTLTFGANDMSAAGFANGVSLGATDGMYVEGKGSFSTGDTALTLRAPFLVDRSELADPRDQAVRPDYSFLTTGDFAMSAVGTNADAKIDGNAAPGARIGIGTAESRVHSAVLEGGRIRASAGIIDIQSATDISLAGAALETPGYEATFGDEADAVTVSAGGGTINLFAANGNILTDSASRLASDNNIGKAGTLNLLASNGAITLDAAINPDATGSRQGSFTFDSGTGTFDLALFIARHGAYFGGDFWVRVGAGGLDLNQGQTINAKSVTLTSDVGAITIAGTISTAGVGVAGLSADAARDAAVDGGDITLWGNAGVTLTSTSRLDTHTIGYADTDTRPAAAGDVILGVASDSAVITVAEGAVIDVGAWRTQADGGLGRMVPQVITDPATGTPTTVYRYVEPDTGGTVTFRAPVIGDNRDKVSLSQRGTILGADSIQLEAFQRYDLDQLIDNGQYSGITRGNDGAIQLDFAATGANPFTENFTLGDGTKSLVRFIQDFDVSTVDGSSLAGMRLRPGVELTARGDIETTSQWNLAAATFSPQQLQAAVDAGVLQVIPEISSGTQTQYKVVPGKEGALLDRFATFLYRVDGSARGEAPVITMRAGGNLTVNRSISDGFFTFRDKSDPGYINYQLGGGARGYSPAIQFSCGGATGFCGNIASYGTGANPGVSSTLTITLSSAATPGGLTSGAPYVNSPLALTGNGAAGAVDANGNPVGDTLGFGELFPLLDGNVEMHSSDLRLVAGAGEHLSANPLIVDRALNTDLTVTGEYSYRLTASGSVTYNGPLQFHLLRSTTDTNNVNFNIGDTLDQTTTVGGLNQLKDDAYTQLTWGSSAGLGVDARAAAVSYFAGKGYSFTGSVAAPTGIIAPLNEIVAFLQSFEPTYQAGLASGRTGYAANRNAPVIRYGAANQQATANSPNEAHVRTFIRTGDGNIALAAARDVDLRGSEQPVYRNNDGVQVSQPSYFGLPNQQAAQFASAAVYTAGVRVTQADISARIVDTNERVTFSPDSPYLDVATEMAAFIPSPRGLTDNQPVLAQGGGDVWIDAGRDVLGQRDAWTPLLGVLGQPYSGGASGTSTAPIQAIGSISQIWRVGQIGVDTELGVSPSYFTSGVGALGGGDVRIGAGRDISDLTVSLLSGVTTTSTDAGNVMATFGSGSLSAAAGRDILGGRFDIATGAATIHAERNIAQMGVEPITLDTPQYLRVRLSDAVVDVSAKGSAMIASVSALGVDQSVNSAGFFSPNAAFGLSANEAATIAQTAGVGTDTEFGKQPAYIAPGQISPLAYVQLLPPTLELTSIRGAVELPQDTFQLLYPSVNGQLRIFSHGSIEHLALGMSDVDPGILGGAFTAQQAGRIPVVPVPFVTSTTTDATLRAQHNQRITHLGDPEPIRIYTDGDIDESALFLPKQARITASGDIVDMFFNGQNVSATDITRVRSGGDITGTTVALGTLPFIKSNNFILGGPGTFIVEAGRDLGPFVTSADVLSPIDRKLYSFAGGIRTIGNDYNPWLVDDGAKLSVRFGMAAGADYAALRETYLNPENLTNLDGDLFVQVTDAFGNKRPDRSKFIYAPLLAEWLKANDPIAFAAIFGGETFPDTDTGRATLADAAYERMADLYAAFAKVDPLRQQDFLVDGLYFHEIAAVSDINGPSYQQYIRGYRAVQTLFPTSRGYTDNLAPYTLDPSTISVDHPLGEPVRNIVKGQPQAAERVITGNVDLRLATLQTVRGGDLTILGPGGDVIAGSVVRTADQSSRRTTAFDYANPTTLPLLFEAGNLKPFSNGKIASIPLGYEGILTLRGGAIRSFTDGDFILNQSRVFTQQSGDITMWSSNGDLNAGQGPKSASNFPPVTVRFDENGLAEVNSAGSVSGAGIGTFKRTPTDPASNVILIAPVGEVDAGDAGVRASGNVVVAAARVANADNFKAAGDITGVPAAAVTPAVATPAAAASAVAAQAANAAGDNQANNRRSLITVDVLGPLGSANGGKRCPDSSAPDDSNCR
ncbi:MAG: filamentous hemagglutinin family protein [Sphingobium sp.]|nr:filamentous hemagglutinin family protein [Sphingobium sp.]